MRISRNMSISVRLAAAFALVPFAARAQRTAAAAQAPSMAETKRWVEVEGRQMLNALSTHTNGAELVTSRYRPVDLRFDGCNLVASFVDTTIARSVGAPWDTVSQLFAFRVPLAKVDVGALISRDAGEVSSDRVPLQHVVLKLRTDEVVDMEASLNGVPAKGNRVASLVVRSKEDGDRLANALRRAATLCGAPASPF